jgi:hypothetical protein
LIPDHAEQIRNADDEVIDHRRLSIALHAIGVFSHGPRSVLQASPNEVHGCGSHGQHVGALHRGFHVPELLGAWIAGAEGQLKVDLDRVPSQLAFEIELSGRRSLETGDTQTATIVVNAKPFGEFEISEESTRLRLDISEALSSSGRITVQIRAKHAEPTFDAAHTIVDNRLLGLFVRKFGFVEPSYSSEHDDLAYLKRKPALNWIAGSRPWNAVRPFIRLNARRLAQKLLPGSRGGR